MVMCGTAFAFDSSYYTGAETTNAHQSLVNAGLQRAGQLRGPQCRLVFIICYA